MTIIALSQLRETAPNAFVSSERPRKYKINFQQVGLHLARPRARKDAGLNIMCGLLNKPDLLSARGDAEYQEMNVVRFSLFIHDRNGFDGADVSCFLAVAGIAFIRGNDICLFIFQFKNHGQSSAQEPQPMQVSQSTTGFFTIRSFIRLFHALRSS